MMNTIQSNEELYHYGVKGMKWGVRRFQNYDGSYTKKGLERFRKAESDYDTAVTNRAKTKEAYKSGAATKQQYKTAKSEVGSAKREMSKSYKQLKTDKMADQGKELYKRGKTITGNMHANAIAQVGVIVGSRVAQRVISSTVGDQKIANLTASAVGIGGTVVNMILAGKTYNDNKKLRAYYGH
jgi:hypothetical protein